MPHARLPSPAASASSTAYRPRAASAAIRPRSASNTWCSAPCGSASSRRLRSIHPRCLPRPSNPAMPASSSSGRRDTTPSRTKAPASVPTACCVLHEQSRAWAASTISLTSASASDGRNSHDGTAASAVSAAARTGSCSLGSLVRVPSSPANTSGSRLAAPAAT